jgi:anaerobic magnesium-protoporphyrin IX monomethyl ester cyclase
MRYQHALCLYPYYRAELGDFFPSAGIEYVATALKEVVGTVTLIDLRVEKDYCHLGDLTRFIAQHIDLICVSVNVSFFFRQACNLLNYLPPDIPLIVGGKQATDHVEELFQTCPHIDIIVRGEGEQTIREIAQGKALEEILGISYKQDGQILHNPNRPLLPADTFIYPDRILRRSTYHFFSKKHKLFNLRLDTVLTARGCPYNCKFCNFSTNPLGQKRHFSARSPESVVEEIKSLDADLIFLADENFCVDPKRTERICDLLIEQHVRKKFVAFVRIEVAKHPSLLKKLEQAGVQILFIGVESAYDCILQQLNKGFTTQDVREAFQVLRQYRFFFLCTFIYGNIGESREEMLAIADFAEEIGADAIFPQNLQARKFSHIKEIVEKTTGYHLDPEGFVYSDTYSKQELKQVERTINKRFYSLRRKVQMVWKLHRLGCIAYADLLNMPSFLWRVFAKKFRTRHGGQRVGITYN